MKNWIVSLAVLAVAAAVFWADRPDAWQIDRAHVAQARCDMIETSIQAIVFDGALREQIGYEDLESAFAANGHIDVGTSWRRFTGSTCEGIATWTRWTSPNQLESLPARLGVNPDGGAALVFDSVDIRPWRQVSTLGLSFHCGDLCAQFWELEFVRRDEEWVLVNITHTGSS